jgi:hypothetical protein
MHKRAHGIDTSRLGDWFRWGIGWSLGGGLDYTSVSSAPIA